MPSPQGVEGVGLAEPLGVVWDVGHAFSLLPRLPHPGWFPGLHPSYGAHWLCDLVPVT